MAFLQEHSYHLAFVWYFISPIMFCLLQGLANPIFCQFPSKLYDLEASNPNNLHIYFLLLPRRGGGRGEGGSAWEVRWKSCWSHSRWSLITMPRALILGTRVTFSPSISTDSTYRLVLDLHICMTLPLSLFTIITIPECNFSWLAAVASRIFRLVWG